MKPVNVLGDPNVAPPGRLVAADRASLAANHFQDGKFLVAADWNLIGLIAHERDRRAAIAFGNPGFRTIRDYLMPAGGSATPYRLRMYGSWALVGQEVVYVGPPTDAPQNAATPMNINFGPPPASGTRVDFAFVEVYVVEVAPREAPDAASKVLYDGGSTDFGADLTAEAFADHDYYLVREEAVTSQGDGTDAEQETTRRFQVRWRVRVVEGVNPTAYPDYFADPTVNGRGDAGAGQTIYTYRSLSDAMAGTGVAGDGSRAAAQAFKTIDGYCWGIPVCAAYRVAGDTLLQPGDPNVVGYSQGYVRDLRRPIVPRPDVVVGPPGPPGAPGPPGQPGAPGSPGAPGVVPTEVRATGVTTLVVAAGNYFVGRQSGATGTINSFEFLTAPGDDTGHWNMDDGGAGLYIPYRGGFPLFPRDIAIPPGWRWYAQLMGLVWLPWLGWPGVFNYKVRVLTPGANVQEVGRVDFNLNSANGKGGVQSLATLPGSQFPIPDGGTPGSYSFFNGLWRFQVFTTFPGASGKAQFSTGGIYLHLFATQVS